MAAPSTGQRSLLVRAAWFLLVGWWATGIWLALAWFLNVTIIGIPLGIKLINLVPMVVSLKPRAARPVVTAEGLRSTTRRQHNLLLRAAWFLLVGWWASAIWMAVAYAFAVSILGLPVAVWLFGKLPWVVSLYRY